MKQFLIAVTLVVAFAAPEKLQDHASLLRRSPASGVIARRPRGAPCRARTWHALVV